MPDDGGSKWRNRLVHALEAVRGYAAAVSSPFRREPAARQRLVIVIAALLVCGYAAGVLGYVLATPEIGVRCAFTTVVNHVHPDFAFPPGQPSALRVGDEVLRVGGVEVHNWSQLLRAVLDLHPESAVRLPADFPADDLVAGRGAAAGANHVVLDGQELVRLEFARSGGPATTAEGADRIGPPARGAAWVKVGPAPLEALLPSLLWFCLKIGLFAVGALVFWQRPGDRSARQFFVLCVASFGAYIGGYHWSRIVTQPALLVGFMVCAVLLPAISLHFYLVFPRPKAVLERWPGRVLSAIYGPPAVALVLIGAAYLLVRAFAGDPAAAGTVERLLHLLLYYVIFPYLGVAAAWYLASVCCLVHSFRTAADATERNQVKWILFGAAAAVVPIGYSLYLAYLEQGKFGGGAATWPMFAASAIVTAAYTVSITRYRLMELDQLVSSGAVYFLASLLFGLVYYGLVLTVLLVVGTRLGDGGPTLGHALVIAGTALPLLLAFDLLRLRFKTALDRHFRREKVQIDRTLLRMRQLIGQLADPPTLARQLLHAVAEPFGAARGAVYLRRGDPPLYQLVEALGPAPALAELPPGCPLLERLTDHGALDARPRPTDDPARRQLRLLGGGAAVALTHEGRLLGLLVLGPREAGGGYGAEDLNVLTAFAQIAVLALVSAEVHRTIEVLNRDLQGKVEKIAEQQRRILALQSQLSRGERAGKRDAEDGDGAAGPAPARPAAAAPAGIVGSGAQVQQLLQLVRKVAASESAVLLRGESGTGKELLARAVHDQSPRAGKPFVKVQCSALSPGLLESELFGHVKGAFTSAIRDKVGRFEAAHGGTIFLDEIGDVSPELQTKLLRVLQEKTFERVGSSEAVRVDVRVIAATHRDLEDLMSRGLFREDLFYRLNVIPLRVPPLRERAEDIPELAEHFIRVYAQKAGKDVAGLDDDALALLKSYAWPGNVRQLEHVMERAVVLAEGPLITPDELPREVTAGARGAPPPSAGGPYLPDGADWAGAAGPLAPAQAERKEWERRERELLVRALAAAKGNKAEAARALGLARSTLISRLKRHGLE